MDLRSPIIMSKTELSGCHLLVIITKSSNLDIREVLDLSLLVFQESYLKNELKNQTVKMYAYSC